MRCVLTYMCMDTETLDHHMTINFLSTPDIVETQMTAVRDEPGASVLYCDEH